MDWKQYLRPGIIIWLTLFMCTLALLDGNVGEFTVKESYITLLEAILVVTYGSFFIGRSVEKIKNRNKDSG